jgi:hypothetical protein
MWFLPMSDFTVEVRLWLEIGSFYWTKWGSVMAVKLNPSCYKVKRKQGYIITQHSCPSVTVIKLTGMLTEEFLGASQTACQKIVKFN